MPEGRGSDLPERRAHEAAVQREEAFCAFADALPQPLWTASPDGRLAFCNGGLRRFMGWSDRPGEPPAWSDLIAAEDAARFEREWAAAIAAGDEVRLEVRLRSDRGPRWFLVLAGPVIDAGGALLRWVGTCADIDDRVTSRRALEEGQARFRELADSAPVLIWTLGAHDEGTYFNKPWLEFTGLSEAEVLGEGWTRAVHPDDLHQLRRACGRAGRDRVPFQIVIRIRRHDGEYRWMLNSAVPHGPGVDEGELRGFIGSCVDITEQRRVEESLRASEERFRGVVESNMLAIAFFDASGEVSDANEAFCGLVGYSLAEVRSGGFCWRDVTPPEFHAADARAAEQTRERGCCVPYEKEIVSRTGARIPVLVGCATFSAASGPRAAGFALDLTERKRVEAALRVSEERFRMALLGSPVIVFHQDLELRYTWIHGELPGLEREEVVGRRDEELVAPEDATQLATFKRGVLERGARERRTVRLTTLDGEVRSFDLTLEPLRDERGQVVGITGAAMEITERVRLEEQLREQAALLQTADRRKDEFLALLGHELRNPLAPIRSAVDLLRLEEDPAPARVRWARDVIARQVERMARLIEDLLDVARITQDRIALRREPLDLRDVVTRAVETAAPLLEQRRQVLRVLLPPAPVPVEGDAARLEQVLTNLLNNAAHYSPLGGEVAVEATREGARARLAVRDTGRGIPQERLEQIFEPFAQLDPTPDRRNGGLGLGLSLVRRLVSMHGGTVEARSGGPGLGSEFVVQLPLNAPPREGAPTGEHHRVLIVDDDLAAAQALGVLLEAMGHDVLVKYSGSEALKEAQAFGPDVALLDVDLPTIDGYELARRLRQGLATSPPAMVAVLPPGYGVDRRMAVEAGFDRHLVKPLDLSLLQDLLTSLERAHRSRARPEAT